MLTERIVVRRYIYPVLTLPPPTLQFADQFTFRPTGSTTAAIISLLNTIINLLSTEPYVIVISLDFSKAFDTVRHSSLLHKLAQLHIPDHIYNWLTDFFHSHSHCTVFRGLRSTRHMCRVDSFTKKSTRHKSTRHRSQLDTRSTRHCDNSTHE